MSRFKEKHRIDNAIKYSDEAELNWAENYCSLRLSLAKKKDHRKYWKAQQQKVNKALLTENTE